MILPVLSPWNAGTQPDDALFDEVSYAAKFLLSPPEVMVTQSTPQNVPTGTATATAITFASAAVDNDGMWAASTPNRITVRTSGWYEAEYSVAWLWRGDTTMRGQGLYLNGNLSFCGAGMAGHGDYQNNSAGYADTQVAMNYDLFLTVGDTVSLGVIHNVGDTLSTAPPSATAQTFLRLRWASL